MLEQFAREWLQLYPQARILVAAAIEDLRGDQRRLFVARSRPATGTRIVIVPLRVRADPAVTPTQQRAYLDRELGQHPGMARSSARAARA